MEILYVNDDIYLGETKNFKKNDKFGSLILSDETKIYTEFKDDMPNG